ncbi:MAG: YceI family protein [Frankiales bacterium]|nr:YceI family protein [Frankiales bacterium]
MTRRPRGGVRWVLAAVVLGALALVAGPWLYIHLVEGEPPAALSATAPTSAAPAICSVEGTWTVGDRSRAGYRVPEVLGGQRTEAVGRTDEVTGRLTVRGSAVTAGSFSVDLASVRSDQDRRDAQFRDRIMDASTYPTAVFSLSEPVELGPLAAGAGTRTVQAVGTLALHGTTGPVTAALTAVRSGDGVEVTGTIAVAFADFGIDNPSFGGFVEVGDDGTVEVQLHLRKTQT